MVSMREVEEQLQDIGCNFKMWGRSEIRELSNILMPDEKIAQAVNGSYEGGFALLCVTHYRVLLIDRKPMLLTVEDIRYDMMSGVDFHNRLMGATVRIFTPNRNLVFTSWSATRLRKCVNYIQQRVSEMRHHGWTAQQLQSQVGVPQLAQSFNQGQQQLAAQSPQGQEQPGRETPYMPANPYSQTPMKTTRRSRFPNFY